MSESKTSDPARFEDELLQDAREQRTHQQQLAKIESDERVKIAQVEADARKERDRYEYMTADERRPYIMGGIVAIIVGIVAVTGWQALNHDGDQKRITEQRKNEQTQVTEQKKATTQQETIQKCIAAGNIWTADGSCLIAQKPAK